MNVTPSLENPEKEEFAQSNGHQTKDCASQMKSALPYARTLREIVKSKFHRNRLNAIDSILSKLDRKYKNAVSFGCGMGNIEFLGFTKWCDEIVTTDIGDDFIFRDYPNAFFHKVQDARNSDFEDNSFDLVFHVEMIEHVPVSDASLILQENWRILKPGGVLYFITPNFFRITNLVRMGIGQKIIFPKVYNEKQRDDIDFYRDVTHFHEYTIKELNSMTMKAGFQDVSIFGYSLGIPSISSVDLVLSKLAFLGWELHVAAKK